MMIKSKVEDYRRRERERERERGAKKKILFLNVFAVAVTLCQWFSVGAIERGCGILPNLLKRHANFKWRLFRYGIDQHLNYGPDLFFFLLLRQPLLLSLLL